MMEFKEMVQKNPTVYPTIIPDDLKGVIYDWFQFREVCDDEKFEVFFKRLLNNEYPHYKQLLRIEPGISDYDWLVTNYEESKNVKTVQGVLKDKKSGNNDTTNKIKYGSKVTEDGSITDTGTKKGTESTATDKKKTFGSNITRTGTVTDEQTGNITDNNDTETLTTDRGTISDIGVSHNSNTKTLDLTEANTAHKGQGITNTHNSTETPNLVVSNEGFNDTKTAEKQLPQESANIQMGEIVRAEATNRKIINDLDWTYASAQQENTLYNINNEKRTGSNTINSSDTTTYGEGNDTSTLTKTGTDSDSSEADNNTTKTLNTDNTIKVDGTLKRDFDLKNEETLNTKLQYGGDDITDEDSTITYDLSEGNTKSVSNSIERAGDDITNILSESTETRENESKFVTENLHINTGRMNYTTAHILNEAKNFIQASNAWDFLRRKLESVFLAYYEI